MKMDLGSNVDDDNCRVAPIQTSNNLDYTLVDLSHQFPLFSEEEKDLRSDLRGDSVNDPNLRSTESSISYQNT